jgi:hypothetical protein
VSRDAAVLLAIIVAGAAVLVVHAALLLRVLTRKKLGPWWRALALVPVVTPVAGWRAGERRLCGLWAGCAVLYGVLRLVAR